MEKWQASKYRKARQQPHLQFDAGVAHNTQRGENFIGSGLIESNTSTVSLANSKLSHGMKTLGHLLSTASLVWTSLPGLNS
eukprot:569318-Amphidinium_carterae.1